MNIISLVSLGAGIAVFMYGMILIRKNLEKNFKTPLKYFLSRFTKNRFSATFTGAFITFAMQSSSASSVLTANFVDSGILSLYKAFWVIVGANIGTTFTGLLTAVDFSAYTPLICIVGVLFISFSKSEKLNALGELLTGFGLLFIGINVMNSSVEGIKSSEFFMSVLSMAASPLSGLLIGAFFTAIIHSSSATTALLQTLASDGIIGIRHAFYIILGANIGTCATCAVSTAGLKNGAKKVSLIHILYNLVGSLIFLAISFFIPLPEIAENIFPGSIKTQIAFINIIFNIATAVFVLIIPVNENSFAKHNKLINPCLQSKKLMIK